MVSANNSNNNNASNSTNYLTLNPASFITPATSSSSSSITPIIKSTPTSSGSSSNTSVGNLPSTSSSSLTTPPVASSVGNTSSHPSLLLTTAHNDGSNTVPFILNLNDNLVHDSNNMVANMSGGGAASTASFIYPGNFGLNNANPMGSFQMVDQPPITQFQLPSTQFYTGAKNGNELMNRYYHSHNMSHPENFLNVSVNSSGLIQTASSQNNMLRQTNQSQSTIFNPHHHSYYFHHSNSPSFNYTNSIGMNQTLGQNQTNKMNDIQGGDLNMFQSQFYENSGTYDYSQQFSRGNGSLSTQAISGSHDLGNDLNIVKSSNLQPDMCLQSNSASYENKVLTDAEALRRLRKRSSTQEAFMLNGDASLADAVTNMDPKDKANIKKPTASHGTKSSASTNPNNKKTRTKDKYRVVYNEFQRTQLEREYEFSKYITSRRKSELAGVLDLSQRQIKIWFQNRRAKDRKIKKKRNETSQSVTSNPDSANTQPSITEQQQVNASARANEYLSQLQTQQHQSPSQKLNHQPQLHLISQQNFWSTADPKINTLDQTHNFQQLVQPKTLASAGNSRHLNNNYESTIDTARTEGFNLYVSSRFS